ncbi:hypothetical protein M404DRAFT_26885 [Pisolithus tinctorius Marx 270]|uniref:Uncharacterized protein n=1 Tax=Pisolithus tinctorius Marx 270 TaxID=870435 RepID=A0A0C3P7E9_PISTI|nr:hypothetical protein M404DRAFT_26885 [Pisolithus tinctorius Marx 270]
MKRLAARDFEDLLQCAMPPFENLLPEPHNSRILNLLFDLATWHAYAKLRLHTSDTLDLFDSATVSLGQTVRTFMKTMCEYYDTRELPQETAVHGHRTTAMAVKTGTSSSAGSSGPKRKFLNLQTYKFHALGDYPNTIRQRGTTDNYTTQPGEFEHRRLKRRYPRTSKNHATTMASMSKHEARERVIDRIVKSLDKLACDDTEGSESGGENRPRQKRERSSPSQHYHIAASSRIPVDIPGWLSSLAGDRATEDFVDRLKDHLLERILGVDYTGDPPSFSDADRDNLIISHNMMYEHQMLRVNYTTYDLRREQDTINPCTRADIMLLSHETDDCRHPYWYTRVIKIFHVNVRYYDNNASSDGIKQMNVLFVRWFGRDNGRPGGSGFAARRLYRVGFISDDDPDAFGFLDPDVVIRGVHLIPAFSLGRTSEYLGPSFVRPDEDLHEDWRYFDVNMFVDRDMFMRFRGGGIGHKVSREWDSFLQSDCQTAGEEVSGTREEADTAQGAEEDNEMSGEEEDDDTDLDEDEGSSSEPDDDKSDDSDGEMVAGLDDNENLCLSA